MNDFLLPPVFSWLKEQANISLFELARTFNCGIGLLIFVDEHDVDEIISDINDNGYKSFIIGDMIDKTGTMNVLFNGWNI